MNHPCPNCGYCPHCGRSNDRWLGPQRPWYTPVWWTNYWPPTYRTGDFLSTQDATDGFVDNGTISNVAIS